MLACGFNSNIDVIKFLINCGCDLDIKDKEGNNIFLSACYSNKEVEIIKYLIVDIGFSLNYTND